jgi:hypothetical protein
MNRKVRCIIVACMAFCAMAGMASAAQAAKFHAESSPTFLLGNQSEKNVFTVNGKTVECSTAKFEAEFTGTELSKLEKVHPTYSGCTAFGLEATVTTTGCTYTFNEPTGTSSPYSGTVSIVCETGHEIEINAGFGICHVKVGSQANKSSVTYTDEGTGATRSVLVKANVSGITSTVSGSELICGANGTQSATYKGSVLTKGYSNSTHTTQHGIWVQ